MADGATFGISNLGWLQASGYFLQALGAFGGARAARISGEQARARAEFEARQAEKAAGLAFAVAQREAEEQKRQAGIVASRALAVAAASGGGVSDPTIIKILSGIEGEGAYRAQLALYEGEERGRQLRLQAAVGRVAGAEAATEGVRRQTGYQLSGLGSLFRAGTSLYTNYGRGGPDGGSGDSALINETP